MDTKINQKGKALLERLDRASANTGCSMSGLDRVREYDEARLALVRFIKALVTGTRSNEAIEV